MAEAKCSSGNGYFHHSQPFEKIVYLITNNIHTKIVRNINPPSTVLIPSPPSPLSSSLTLLKKPPQTAPASLNNSSKSPFFACRSELPPIWLCLMKIFGTERWFVSSCSASWMAAPSSFFAEGGGGLVWWGKKGGVREWGIGDNEPTWSSSMTKNLALCSFRRALVARQ